MNVYLLKAVHGLVDADDVVVLVHRCRVVSVTLSCDVTDFLRSNVARMKTYSHRYYFWFLTLVFVMEKKKSGRVQLISVFTEQGSVEAQIR